ncbi:peptidoglycan-binding protein [Streptomyces sp. NBC_00988]|uniref:peptidoglycan-binding domain-containing protein n=1 Tax=Streptomyces sp. NBC_00988 TaxID=2903704 RepID=UPI003869A9E5|nr:peptidoglycan-binding protein [Streptomyces sp. NBC_00988]
MRVRRIAAVLTAASILTLGGVATTASADGWNAGTGPRAVSFHDLERPECTNLRMGASGWCTVALQTTLSQVGYKVAIDGKFGPVTNATVLLFQRDNHARMQDGIVGPETRYLLGAAMDIAVSHNNVAKHNDGRWPSIICSPFKIFGMTCEDLVGGSPAY